MNDDPKTFIPHYPWLTGLKEEDLSTKRGFVFQFPPFPTLDRIERDIIKETEVAGLYVHIPFCPYRCSYCYYAVEINRSPSVVDRYLAALEAEAQLVCARPITGKYVFRTLFFGGGTPTFLSEEELIRLVSALQGIVDLSQVEEFTVESDPTKLSLEKAQVLRSLGVNRLSIGIQSFSTEVNWLNERKHTEEESLEAIHVARAAGFANINLDIICGLIGETDKDWEYTLDRLLELAPEHITIYLFSFRPQTISYNQVKIGRVPFPPDEPERIRMYLQARSRLLDHGYVQTTPNCFAREPGYEQVHQRNAWTSLPLIGLGNSAYSYADGCTTQNYRAMKQYIDVVNRGRVPVEIGHRLNAREQMIRYCVLRLKQLAIVRADFEQRFGFDLVEVFNLEIQRLRELDLVELTDQSLSLTTRGIVYIDDVCRTFYSHSVCERLATIETTQESPLVRSLL